MWPLPSRSAARIIHIVPYMVPFENNTADPRSIDGPRSEASICMLRGVQSFTGIFDADCIGQISFSGE